MQALGNQEPLERDPALSTSLWDMPYLCDRLELLMGLADSFASSWLFSYILTFFPDFNSGVGCPTAEAGGHGDVSD